MFDSHTTATPEKTNATSTDHPPVRENQREMLQGRGFANEAEVEQGAMIEQRVMRAIGGGSPAAPPEQFAEALGGVQGRSQAGLWRQMQRGYGNSYVGRVIQAKLTVNQPGDRCEQEADRMAAQVMDTPQSDQSIQREMEPKKEKEKIRMKPSLQLSPDGNQEAGGNLEDQLNNSKGGGSPLPDNVRSFMEPRFGADFSQVRVHTGSESVQMNQDLNAQAFTHRQDVYFGAGKAPAKDALTAHELTHVVQQSGAEVIRASQSTGNCGLSVQKRRMGSDPILRVAPTVQRSTREELLTAYNEALSRSDWNEVAVRLNGFNDTDIKSLVGNYKKATLIAVKDAALTVMPGWNARVVQPVNACLAALMGPDQALHANAKEIQDYLLHSPFLKAYVSSNFSGGNPLEGHIHIDDDAAFRTACIVYTMRRGKTREEAEALEPQQNGFRDGDDIHVRDDGKFTTTIHESMHRFSSPEYFHKLSNNANEGAAEYFTRIICKDQGLKFMASYPMQLNSTDLLIGASSKETVADAYFNGALQALLTAVDTAKGAGTLRRWSLFMNTGSYAQADALLK